MRHVPCLILTQHALHVSMPTIANKIYTLLLNSRQPLYITGNPSILEVLIVIYKSMKPSLFYEDVERSHDVRVLVRKDQDFDSGFRSRLRFRFR